jgi:hypothetical protein
MGYLRRVSGQLVYVTVFPLALHQGRAEVPAGFREYVPQMGGVLSGERGMPVFRYEGRVGRKPCACFDGGGRRLS